MSFFRSYYENTPSEGQVSVHTSMYSDVKNIVPDYEKKHPQSAPKNTFIKEVVPINRTRNEPIKSEINDNKLKIDSDVCDILYIDQQIKLNLIKKIELLPLLMDELNTLRWVSNNSPDALDRINAVTNTTNIRKRIQDIEYGSEYSLYLFRTSSMLSKYRTLLCETKTKSFFKAYSASDAKNGTAVVDVSKVHLKNKIILDYLRIAREYIDLENYKQKLVKPTCDACYSTDLIPSTFDGESLLVCKCGNTIELLDDAPTFKDSERVNMSSRYTYTCRGHLIEAMNRFEGKQNTSIDDSIIEMLKKEIELQNLTPEIATKDHIYLFMTEKKLSEYYADINLIYFKITSKNPPDITKYRDELLEMHAQLEEAYLHVKDENRMNSLNVNWKLYKMLQLLSYDCKKDDFFCLKTPTKQGEHEQKWYDMIEYLKKKYPTAMTSNGKKRWRHIQSV